MVSCSKIIIEVPANAQKTKRAISWPLTLHISDKKQAKKHRGIGRFHSCQSILDIKRWTYLEIIYYSSYIQHRSKILFFCFLQPLWWIGKWAQNEELSREEGEVNEHNDSEQKYCNLLDNADGTKTEKEKLLLGLSLSIRGLFGGIYVDMKHINT